MSKITPPIRISLIQLVCGSESSLEAIHHPSQDHEVHKDSPIDEPLRFPSLGAEHPERPDFCYLIARFVLVLRWDISILKSPSRFHSALKNENLIA